MTTPASRRPCSMVSAPLGAQVRAPGTLGAPGRAAGPRAQARPGTAGPCTLDLLRAPALPQAAGSRAAVPWPKATGTWGSCAWQAARSHPRRPLSIPGPCAAASEWVSWGRRVSEADGGSVSCPQLRCPRSPSPSHPARVPGGSRLQFTGAQRRGALGLLQLPAPRRSESAAPTRSAFKP